MRWLGALLLVGACGGAGFARTAALRRRIALLEWLCVLLRQVRTELTQRNAPLPDILEQMGDERLTGLAARLRKGMTVYAAAAPDLRALEEERGLPEAARILSQLARVLGRYDGFTQGEACDYALKQLEAQRDGLARELAEKGKLYHTVPLALGLMAALAVL